MISLHVLQVTIGASATQVSSTQKLASQVIVQNNAAHTIRVGDSSVTSSIGASLATGGASINLGEATFGNPIDLSSIYIAGTQNDVVDVIYIN